MNKCHYIFVTGGVASSLGKGLVAASLGKLLQARESNWHTRVQLCDWERTNVICARAPK